MLIALQNPVAQVIVAILRGRGPSATARQGGDDAHWVCTGLQPRPDAATPARRAHRRWLREALPRKALRRQHDRSERSEPLRPEQTNNPNEKRNRGVRGERSAPPPRRRPQRNRRPIPDRNPHSGAGRGVSERGSGFPNRARSAGSQKPSRGSEPDDFQPQPAATSPASRTSRLDAGPSRSATGGFSFALRNRLVFCRLKIVFGNPDTSGHPSNTTAVHPEWGSSLDRGFR